MAESFYRWRFSIWAAALAILALSAPWTFDHLINTPYTTIKPILWWYPKAFIANLFSSKTLQNGFIRPSPQSSSSGGEQEAAAAAAAAAAPFVCDPDHAYTTTIISLDPLLLYITAFLSPSEMASLVAAGEPDFAPSYVIKNGRRMGTPDRTSQSAGLPRDDPAVRCVLARARAFLGPALFDARRDDMGPPQLVRYAPGQRFNVHHDWYETPQPPPPPRGDDDDDDDDAWRGTGWNRVASFFAILEEDECEGGETWFPLVEPHAINAAAAAAATTTNNGDDDDNNNNNNDSSDGKKDKRPVWRIHEDGGVAFRPVAGNALFWVNLHANGTGDRRTLHAGLPVEEGRKTAMNIWPRKYYE